MSIRIQNVIFDPKNNNFLISRGGTFTAGAFTEKGVPVIKLKGYENYYFDPSTWEIVSRRGRRAFRVLKKHVQEGRDFFYLFRNGVQSRVYAWEILRDNINAIESYYSDDSKKTIRA